MLNSQTLAAAKRVMKADKHPGDPYSLKMALQRQSVNLDLRSAMSDQRFLDLFGMKNCKKQPGKQSKKRTAAAAVGSKLTIAKQTEVTRKDGSGIPSPTAYSAADDSRRQVRAARELLIACDHSLALVLDNILYVLKMRDAVKPIPGLHY